MNKKELISKIKTLTDLTDTERAHLIELVNTKKKYGLVWEDKPEDVEEQLRSMLPVLNEVKEKAIVNGAEHPNHILIEGDNLHALTAMTFTHEGKIDVIYIDPPYNTGNKDFVYNDTFIDYEDSFRHSKWLSFMSKRLQIAKSLLNQNGILFISIDDNEVAQLKLLCNDVFGENNFITQFLWEKTSTPPSLSKKVRKKMEYVLCYEKCRDNSSYSIGKVDGGDVPLLNSGNARGKLKFPVGSIKFNIPDGIYTDNLERKVNIINESLIVENSLNANEVVLEGNFKWKQLMLDKEVLLGTHFIIKTELFSIRFQRRDDNLKTKTPTNRLDKELNVGTNEDAKKEIDELSINYFDYPKPLSLVKLLINLKYKENSTILDFFAGSGTTLHATMALNSEDGGNRQCILVTNNENNICEEVTYERNKRVIEGYTNAKGEAIEGLNNNNLRYYKAEFVPSERNEVNRRRLTQESTDLLCIKEDCYNNVSKDFTLNEKEAKLFTNGLGKYMLVLYHSRNQMEVIEKLTAIIPTIATKEKIKLYAFSPEKETIEEDFFSVADKIEAVPLPDSIYNAYRATFRTLKLDKKQTATVASQTTEQE
ncbi:site-specific DNA-methyltransferase [Flavobacterium cheonanense]|uniref:site-specific DNA-methyltransferase (adenine-specific) n=1 Tax=Flavobacterium cheonanense TaxID=706183 RepID=A0ABP7VU94_9FLAO